MIPHNITRQDIIKAILENYEKTNIKDLALVCANCHRMLHRKRPWLSIEQLKQLIK